MENITGFNPINDDNYKNNHFELHHKLTISRTVVYSVVCLLGTIGNGLVIWCGVFRMKKTVNMVWFLNLAIADFFFTLILAFNITYFVIHRWPFGRFICDLYWFLFFLNMSVSILHLVVISLDRFLCVFCPVWCQNHRKPRLALLVALSIWTICIAFSLPIVIFNGKSGKHTVPCYGQRNIYSNKWIGITRCIFFFLLPFLIILFCYVAITLRLRRKRMTTSSRPYKIILAVIIAFFVCWFPYNLFVLLRMLGTSRSDKKILRIVNVISDSLMLINSCINPILYVLIGQNFKKILCNSLQVIFEKAFTEDMEKTVSKKREGSTGNLELSNINAFKNTDII